MALSVATHLAAEGLTVIAGLAAGIDTAAHRAALDSHGRTVGVIGTGIRKYYPADNRELQDQIARDGLLLSQFYPDAPPSKTSFPMRNATMSGYGIATVVVEAGEKSGARIQARLAVEHGRPVILSDMVVEANEWAKKLCSRPGVYVASSVGEVMDHVHEVDEESTAMLEAFAHSGG
jgi:DNA processing protein